MASSHNVMPFVPPEWSRGLKCIPEKKFKLAQVPTPLHKWDLPGVADGFEVFIKREDLAGAALSGNKVRKLELILAEAVDQGCDCVVTIGSVQSNHARVTAVASRLVGLDAHLLLISDEEVKPEDFPVMGNVLLDRLVGANIYSVAIAIDNNSKVFEYIESSMSNLKDTLRRQNKNPYVIAVGGAGVTGLWGYIDAFQEMIEQGVLESIDDIFLPVSTGGTALGLAIGSYLNGSTIKVHAVLVASSAELMFAQMNSELSQLRLLDDKGDLVKAEDLLEIIDDYAGSYGKCTTEEKELLCKISTTTGIILDTTFTLKAANGMLSEMKKNPGRFKGRRVLFVHTGGLFGIMNGVLSETVLSTEETNRIQKLSDFVNSH